MSSTNENVARIDEIIALIIEAQALKKKLDTFKTKVETFEKHVKAVGKEIKELKNDTKNTFTTIEEKQEKKESMIQKAYAFHDKGYKVTITDDNGNLWEVDYLASLDRLPCLFGFPVMLEIQDRESGKKVILK